MRVKGLRNVIRLSMNFTMKALNASKRQKKKKDDTNPSTRTETGIKELVSALILDR